MRAGRVLAVALVALLAAGACRHKKTEAQLAADALARGLKAHTAGNLAEASKDYHDVLAHDPNNKFAYFDLGVIDQAAGRNAEAEGNYRSALKTDPDFEPALFNLAILRTAIDINEAISLYRHAAAVSPNEATVHLNLGFALRQAGDVAAGEAELARAVQLDPALQSRITPPQPAGTTTPTVAGRTKP